MGYVGNQQTEGFSKIPPKQDLTGATGSTLTLSNAVSSPESIDLFINNVRQEPTESYTTDGTTVNLVGYTVAATDDIYVVYNSLAQHTSTHPSNQALQATSGTFSGALSATTGTFSSNVDINGNDFILDADGDTKIVASTDDLIEFYTANTQHMTIDASGNTTIRTGGTAYANVSMGYSGLTQVGLAMNDTDSSGSTQAIIFRKNGSQVGAIVNTVSGVAYNSASDYRLKENVTGITDATSRLKQLNPVRFNFIADADNTVDGFLAHEVQTVVPEAITGTHNEVDDDGNPVYQGIDQSKLVPLLVKTIQELEARITALENA